MKYCTGCERHLPLDSYYEYKYSGVLKLTTRCKECHKAYREKNRANRSRNDREYRLKKVYGISVKDFEDQLEAQEGVCYICKKCNNGRQLCVDHCHKTGSVRKLLCTSCNAGLGNFKDDPDLLLKAITYLGEHDE